MRNKIGIEIILLLLVFMYILGCLEPNRQELIQQYIPNNEYEIYSTVILQKFANQSIDKVVVRNLTTNITTYIDDLQYIERANNKVDIEIINDYKKKNLNRYKLENKFSIPQRLILISDQELNDIFPPEIPSEGPPKGWNLFYERYPNSPGIIELSRVGFNNNYTQALLYYGIQSDFVAGNGYLVLLSKRENKWIIKQQFILWVS